MSRPSRARRLVSPFHVPPFCSVGRISRRDFSLQVKEKMLFVGFVLLMTLMVTVIYNDLTRIAWVERLMPWR